MHPDDPALSRANRPTSRGSRAGAEQGRAYGTSWKGKKLAHLAKHGFHVVRASSSRPPGGFIIAGVRDLDKSLANSF